MSINSSRKITSFQPTFELIPRLLLLLDDEVNADALAALIRNDAGLTADILQVCNSAAVGGSRRSDSLQDAIRRLGILTNCDDDLFAQTNHAFRQPFDLVITSEQVGAYKPSVRHFERFQEVAGVSRPDWVHVACSWHHDIVPARRLGIQRVWLDRDKTGEDAQAASARVESATEIGKVVSLCLRTLPDEIANTSHESQVKRRKL